MMQSDMHWSQAPSSGIGWHFAEALARRGYPVIAVSNQPDRLDDLRKKLEKEYGISG